MAESTAAFPYETRLNLLHGPLEVIDVKAHADAARSNGSTRRSAR